MNEIEFIGGPIDGHKERLRRPLQPFVGAKAAPTSQAGRFLAMLAWLLRERKPTAKVRLAIYELGGERGQPCYRYLHTQVITRCQLRREDSLVAMLTCLENDARSPGGAK